MADIAKMFLDGARPVGARNDTAPAARRMPPAAVAPAPVATPAREAVTEPEAETSVGLPAVMVALSLPAQDANGWRLVASAAAGLAAELSTTVGVLGMQHGANGPMLVLEVHGAETADDLPVVRAGHGSMDLQVARALYTLRASVGMWLIVAPEPADAGFGALAKGVGHLMLACPTSNDGLVAAYQHFKRACKGMEGQAGVKASVFLLTDDFAQAAQVHKRLRTATREFLKTDIGLAGVGPVFGQAAVRLLALPANGAMETVWGTIVDELCAASHDEQATHEEAVAPVPEVPVAPVARPRAAVTSARPPEDIEDALERLHDTAEDVAEHSAAAAHAMLDHLAQVLDPEEREALSAAFDDEEPLPVATRATHQRREPEAPRPAEPAEPMYDIRSQVAAPVIIEVPAVAKPVKPAAPVVPQMKPPVAPPAVPTPIPEAPKPDPVTTNRGRGPAMPAQPVGVTLRAFDYHEKPEQDRVTQWQAVERSVRDLVPESVLLEARPPMSWASDSCLAIDGEGKLHIWTLYKDGASWFALREWATEHRDILALTRRDLVLDREAAVTVHIVVPLDNMPDTPVQTTMPGIVSTILRTPAKHIHLYRLRTLQWNARRGLIVVPIC